MIIVSWNIEKCGLSSAQDKRAALDTLLFDAAYKQYADIIFLCEVHGARVDDFAEFLTNVYGQHYAIDAVDGNYSNNYVFLVNKNVLVNYGTVSVSNWQNERPMLAIQCGLSSGTVYAGFIHAKSGQTGLTKHQIHNCARWLQDRSADRWFLSGDLNWDYNRQDELTLPEGAQGNSYWFDMSQRKGGLLDWALCGKYTTATTRSLSLLRTQHDTVIDMSQMDHKPVLFGVR
ncbi:hypothetical protein [Emcibacter sp.]|uniref:hypothetical protein n=1 Tax=Emcibacter sp. TaxID=1979954 RepID=UPI003A8D15E6